MLHFGYNRQCSGVLAPEGNRAQHIARRSARHRMLFIRCLALDLALVLPFFFGYVRPDVLFIDTFDGTSLF